MPEDRRGWSDRLVEALATAMNALGLNGTRLLWKWNRRKHDRAEAGVAREVFWRSATGPHKMCPACRALVARSARTCTECGTDLGGVSAPGVGRLLVNFAPGITNATSLILLVNGFWFLAMFMAQVKAGLGGGGGLFGGFDLELMVRFGAGLSQPRTLSNGDVTGGEWWRLITPVFLHGGLLHFAFNSYVLVQLGRVAEDLFGTGRFWVVYLLCGLAGSAASQLPRYVITVGASGAIMGLMGLLLVYGWRRGGTFGQGIKSEMLRFGVYILVFSLIFPNIDHLNHLGGFACGALLGFVVADGPPRSPARSGAWQALALGGVLLVLVAFFHVAAQGRLGAP